MVRTLTRNRRIWGLLACMLLLPTVARSKPSEYDVKAAFLYQFTRFVEWPSGASGDSNSPFVIGVLGDDPFGAILDQAVRGKDVEGKRIVIKRFSRLSDLQACQVLYVSASESNHISSVLDKTSGHGTLTVSDIDHFAGDGGMIELSTRDGKVGFEINTGAAKRSGLKISSKLLKLASSVR